MFDGLATLGIPAKRLEKAWDSEKIFIDSKLAMQVVYDHIEGIIEVQTVDYWEETIKTELAANLLEKFGPWQLKNNTEMTPAQKEEAMMNEYMSYDVRVRACAFSGELPPSDTLPKAKGKGWGHGKQSSSSVADGAWSKWNNQGWVRSGPQPKEYSAGSRPRTLAIVRPALGGGAARPSTNSFLQLALVAQARRVTVFAPTTYLYITAISHSEGPLSQSCLCTTGSVLANQ